MNDHAGPRPLARRHLASRLLRRLAPGRWRPARIHDEIAEELRFHIDRRAEENMRAGMGPAEARLAAQRSFGSLTLIEDQGYDVRGFGWLEALIGDLRYGMRLLRKHKSFSAIAILTLALGIGANTAIFQVINAVRLRSLPVQAPSELAEVLLSPNSDRSGHAVGRHIQITEPLWTRLRDTQQVFTGMFAWGVGRFNTMRGGPVRMIDGLWVSGDYFNILGVRPALGRVFTNADDTPGCGSPGAVISYPFWQREYGGSPSVIGRPITLNNHPFDIVGVASAEFFGMEMGRSFDVAIPICAQPLVRPDDVAIGQKHFWWLAAAGRLKPGVSVSQADAHVRLLSKSLFRDTVPEKLSPDEQRDYQAFELNAIGAASGVASLTAYDTPMWALLAITAIVLLIACANLANLMLARASAREREIAVRMAIGASRGRVVRQLVAESLLLALIGTAAGWWLAGSFSHMLVSFLSTQDERLFIDLGTDWRALLFMAMLATLTCLLFGLMPALRATRATLATVMKTGGRGTSETHERFSLRRALVIAQVALSLVLIVGALLFVRTLTNLTRLDPGFRQDDLIVADLDVSALKVPVARRAALYDDLLTRLRARVGIDAAAGVYYSPLSGMGWNDSITTDGRDGRVPKALAFLNRVTPEYFRTMGATMLAGRDFDARDTAGAPKVAIVTETFAREVLRGSNPIGERIAFERRAGQPDQAIMIVGVVRDMKYRNLREPFKPTVFFPIQQDEEVPSEPTFVIRSTASLETLTPRIAAALRDVSPDITVRLEMLRGQAHDSLLTQRLLALLAGFFGALAALLAMIGLYGVMSYVVARRNSEIGIRMALGAERRDILWMILRESTRLSTIGLVSGIVLAVLAARTISSLLFDVTPGDPVTIALAVAGLATVATLASAAPAVRASRLDPLIALRED